MLNHARSQRARTSPSKALGSIGTQQTPAPSKNALKGAPVHTQEAILLDVWITSASGPLGLPLTALVSEITLIHMPKARTDASNRRTEIITTIVANFLMASPPTIAVPQGRLRATRYDRPAITGRQLKPTLDELEASGLIVRTPAIFKQRRTTIAPTPRLTELIAENKLTIASIARLPDEEVIILKRRKARTARASSDDDNDGEKQFITINQDSSTLIDYPDDCDEANALRSHVRAFNTFISKADIRIEGNTQPHQFKPFVRYYSSSGPIVFNSHGRLYSGQVGGWHQALTKEDRKDIRINGESVIDLDFTNMHLRLAYREARCTPPSGDLYSAIKGLGAFRPAVKIVISAMLSRTGDLKKLPSNARELLPKQWTGKRIAQAIREHHAPIAHLFGQDKGMQYMWQDSEVLMEVLTRLMRKGIPALPMHDGIMVQESVRALAQSTMQEVSLDLIGVVLPVEAKVY
jgi:DNA-binding MarR family transcriptional regulator